MGVYIIHMHACVLGGEREDGREREREEERERGGRERENHMACTMYIYSCSSIFYIT